MDLPKTHFDNFSFYFLHLEQRIPSAEELNVWPKLGALPMLLESFARQVIGDLPIRAKTRSTYSSMLTCHIGPSIGYHQVDGVTRSDIQRSIRGLPPQTAAMTLAVIKTVYREAQAQGIIDVSPAH